MAKLSLFEHRRRRVRTALRARASGKPRLSVHRSGRHIYAQVIDDAQGKTLAAASTLDKELKGKAGATRDGAAAVGKTLAERAKRSITRRCARARVVSSMPTPGCVDTRVGAAGIAATDAIGVARIPMPSSYSRNHSSLPSGRWQRA